MSNKNYYKRASFLPEVICFFLCLLLLCLFISDARNEKIETPWILLGISAIVGVYGIYSFIDTISFRLKCKRIKRDGVRHKGRVIDIRKTIKMSSDAGATSYSYLVEYYSALDGRMIRFWTPYTSFVPRSTEITCMVYELSGEYYVDEFK